MASTNDAGAEQPNGGRADRLLGDVMEIARENQIQIQNSKEYTIAGVQNYGTGIVNRRKVKGVALTMKKYQVIEKDQLMWCKVDTKNGAFGITKDEHVGSLASTNMTLAKIKTNICLPEFIETLFQIDGFHQAITKASSGSTNRKYLTPTQLFEQVKIPNLNLTEQRKWLKRINAIKDSGLKLEQVAQSTYLTQLRQAILQEAIEGKLTAEWRVRHPTAPTRDENNDAAVLLERIKAEKAALVAKGKIKNEKPLPSIELAEVPFALPEGWGWTRLATFAESMSTGPFGSMLHKSDYVKDGIPIVNPMNIKNGKITADSRMLISEKTRKRLLRYALKENDIVIARRGNLEKCAVVEKAHENWLCGTGSFFLRIKNIHIPFFLMVYRSAPSQKYLLQDSIGQTMDNLNQKLLQKLPIPVPPLAEQQAIVERVDRLLAMVDQLEQQVVERKVQAEELMQAVLREAFG